MRRVLFNAYLSCQPSMNMNPNPIEHLQTAKAEYYRHVMVDWLGQELLVR